MGLYPKKFLAKNWRMTLNSLKRVSAVIYCKYGCSLIRNSASIDGLWLSYLLLGVVGALSIGIFVSGSNRFSARSFSNGKDGQHVYVHVDVKASKVSSFLIDT
jgi:hypothetical protein